MFSPVWTIGDYKLFVVDNSKHPSRRALDDNIELKGEMHLQPAVSAKRICEFPMKAYTVLGYLESTVNPLKRSFNGLSAWDGILERPNSTRAQR